MVTVRIGSLFKDQIQTEFRFSAHP